MVCIEIVLHMVPKVCERNERMYRRRRQQQVSSDCSRTRVGCTTSKAARCGDDDRTVPLKLRTTRSWIESKPVRDAVKRLVPVRGAHGTSADIVQHVCFDPQDEVYKVYVRFYTSSQIHQRK